jgi:uncharacterized protein (TIGR01777 family)
MGMQYLVTGATGFIGQPLVKQLVDQGHQVVVLSRRADKAKSFFPSSVTVLPWNMDSDTFPAEDAVGPTDAVIHLAGESVQGRWTDKKKEAIRRSRVDGTRRLVEALSSWTTRPKRLISSSAIGFYGDRGDEVLTESSSSGTGFLADVCKAWEAEAQKAEDSGIEVIRIRIGLVLGTSGGVLKKVAPLFRWGLGGRLGSGKQIWSWIHLSDLLRLFHWLLEGDGSGPFNGTAPHPVTQADFTKQLAVALHRPAFLPVPAFGLRTVLGEFSSEILTSKHVVPEASTALGFAFEYATLQQALTDLYPS